MTAPSITTDLIAYNFNLATDNILDNLRRAMRPSHLGESFLHTMAREGDSLTLDLLLGDGADVNILGADGSRPVHEAARNGQSATLAVLINHGAAIDAAIAPLGTTALMLAVDAGSVDTVRLLLQKGARANLCDALQKRTALHRAAEKGDARMAGLLIAAGGDVFAEDSRGMTARDVAASANHRSLEHALLKVMMHKAKFCG